ncbi:hypothetical protein K7X08_015003 [Anisodus acutangulus]|uniref:protein-tyrosine-phosphatase n=1 Tax=Anisodus acutangulus TaxID=402998 RepID=A0A9Q1QV43_9SOLA|nr:hypothetical protein K7X08_015003 [Anisodus acutangulus]
MLGDVSWPMALMEGKQPRSSCAAIIAAYLMKTEQLSQEGDCYNRGQRIDTSKFGADPGLATENISSDVDVSLTKETTPARTYRCKKCRRVVALQGNVVGHVPGKGETAFEWHKRRSGNPFNKPGDECSSVFVEPLRWMRTVEEGALEGKLLCAHCEARLVRHSVQLRNLDHPCLSTP